MVQKSGLRILKSFSEYNDRRFVDLCNEAKYPTDLGGYYIRQLLSADYLVRGKRGHYLLTTKGRSYIARKSLKTTLTPRPHVLIIASWKDKLVVLKRNKQPFLQRNESPATLIRNGETAKDAVKRLLRDRLSETDKVVYAGTFRRIDHFNSEIFDDKIFLIFKAKLSTAPYKEVSNGYNRLIAADEMFRLDNVSRSLIDIYKLERGGYQEKQYHLDTQDFDPMTNSRKTQSNDSEI